MNIPLPTLSQPRVVRQFLVGISWLCLVLAATSGYGDPVDEHSDGKVTQVVKDELKEEKDGDKTVYKQTIEIKNKSDKEITVEVTSHPWSAAGKFKKENGKLVIVDNRLVPADPVPGKWGARQRVQDLKIPAGQTKTVTFTWNEKFKIRYTDVYVNGTPDSATNSKFDVANLSPFAPIRIRAGQMGQVTQIYPFPYPRAVFEDLFSGAATSFYVEPSLSVVPPGWSVDFLSPGFGNPFIFDYEQQPMNFQIQWDLSTPTVLGETAFFSVYVVQPDLDYRYHIKLAAVVVPEPSSAVLIAALMGIALATRFRSLSLGASCGKNGANSLSVAVAPRQHEGNPFIGGTF